MTGTFSRGLIAGAAGTAALHAVTYLDMALRGRPASTVPEQLVDAIAGATGTAVPGRGADVRDTGRPAAEDEAVEGEQDGDRGTQPGEGRGAGADLGQDRTGHGETSSGRARHRSATGRGSESTRPRALTPRCHRHVSDACPDGVQEE